MKKAKTFALHWGSGVIEEEAQIETRYHRPTVQLLKFTRGPAAGSYEIRLCHYDLKGRFQRSPLILDAADVPRLDGTPVVLAGESTVARSWNTQRTFSALGAVVRLERELSGPEARDLLRRMQAAGQ